MALLGPGYAGSCSQPKHMALGLAAACCHHLPGHYSSIHPSVIQTFMWVSARMLNEATELANQLTHVI